MKQQDPNSNRAIKRTKRSFSGSRAVRRATKRLASALGNWQTFGGKTPESGFLLHKPGAMKFH